MTKWPHRSLGLPIPLPKVAREIAREVRESTDQPLDQPLNLDAVTELGGFKVKVKKIDGARDGTRAFCVPMEGNRFYVPVDPTPGERSSKKLEELDLDPEFFMHGMYRHLVAHEVGHSFFYFRSPSARPARIRPSTFLKRSPENALEERFCEEFARELLVPRAAVSELQLSKSELAKRMEVTVAMARRAISNGPMVIIDAKDPTKYDYTVPPLGATDW